MVQTTQNKKTHKQSNQKMGRRHEQISFKKKKKPTQMDNRHMKGCSTLLIIRETQIRTTVRCCLTLARMAIIKKSVNKCWRGCEEKETLEYRWWECESMHPSQKMIWRILTKTRKTQKKKKNRTTIGSRIPLLGAYSEKIKTLIQKNTWTPMFKALLVTIVKIQK